MARRDWAVPGGPVGIFLNGDAIRSVTPEGEPVHDNSLLLLFNAHYEPVQFVLPPRRFGSQWQLELSTADPDAPPQIVSAREVVPIEARSVRVLSRRR